MPKTKSTKEPCQNVWKFDNKDYEDVTEVDVVSSMLSLNKLAKYSIVFIIDLEHVFAG